MLLNPGFASNLLDFLKGELSLSAYRVAMMRVRLEALDSLPARDKNFLYEFETRYAQLNAGAITEYTFKQFLAYAAACEPTGTYAQPKLWFVPETPMVQTETEVTTGTYSVANCELVPA
jgi:hypothetical protein